MNIWVPLTGDESVICLKEQRNKYHSHAVPVTKNKVVVGRVPKKICDHFWKLLSLSKTSICAWVVKDSTVVQVIPLKFLMISFSRPYQRDSMSKEENQRCRKNSQISH